MQEKSQKFTLRDPSGERHPFEGDPGRLTLKDAIQQAVPKMGQEWLQGGYKFKVGPRQYDESDVERTLAQLGVESGQSIEVVAATI